MKLMMYLFPVDSEEHSMYAIVIEPCSLPWWNSGYSVAHGSYHASGETRIIDEFRTLKLRNEGLRLRNETKRNER